MTTTASHRTAYVVVGLDRIGTVSQDIAVHATCPILLIPTTMP